MIGPEIVLVVAAAQNNTIGYRGRMPWHIPTDLRHFKAVTMGAPMIMGRKTFESLPGLLPDREHIVLTLDRDWQAEGAIVVHSPADAIAAVTGDRVSVIGGGQIFNVFQWNAHRLELTKIWQEYQGDTWFHGNGQGDWLELSREDHPPTEDHPAFTFFSLEPDPERGGPMPLWKPETSKA